MKNRGTEHTTLTETAADVVKILKRIPGVKMIAPGKIDPMTSRRSNQKFITVVYTTAGCELIISGQGSQKVAVHTTLDAHKVIAELQTHKRLQPFTFKTRDRKPGI